MPQSKVEMQQCWERQFLIFFFLLCILRRLTCLRCYCTWAGADRQCPSPVPRGTAWDHCWRARRGQGEHPTVLQAPLGLFSPLEGKKRKKPQTKGSVHTCSAGWCLGQHAVSLCWHLSLLDPSSAAARSLHRSSPVCPVGRF